MESFRVGTWMVPASFPPLRESVGGSRRELQEFLGGRVDGALCDVVMLLASELATNAVLHAATEFTLSAGFTPEGVRVGVEDHEALRPAKIPSAPTSLGGRGLRIVNALAKQWGVDATPTGKRVWFEVPTRVG
jgi:anti-sigma regulatory factor (Ser/Thr protein kinase)